MTGRVLTFGGAMLDTFVLIDDTHVERFSMDNGHRAFLLLEEGQKLVAHHMSSHVGGGGVNTAVSFKRLGFDVRCVVKIGRDDRGRRVRDALSAEGVESDFIIESPDTQTGASVLISSQSQNATVLTFRGANSRLLDADLPTTQWQPDLVYVAGLSDGSADVLPSIIEQYALLECFIAVNPGIRQLSSRLEALDRLFVKASLLSLNAHEAAILIPKLLQKFPRARSKKLDTDNADARDLIKRGLSGGGFSMTLVHFFEAVLAIGPKCVLVTDGARGAYAATAEGITFCPALPADVRGTAGAGDAFSSTFAAMTWLGSSAADALTMATLNANSVIKYADTLSGLLNLDALSHARAEVESNMDIQSWPFDVV